MRGDTLRKRPRELALSGSKTRSEIHIVSYTKGVIFQDSSAAAAGIVLKIRQTRQICCEATYISPPVFDIFYRKFRPSVCSDD